MVGRSLAVAGTLALVRRAWHRCASAPTWRRAATPPGRSRSSTRRHSHSSPGPSGAAWPLACALLLAAAGLALHALPEPQGGALLFTLGLVGAGLAPAAAAHAALLYPDERLVPAWTAPR